MRIILPLLIGLSLSIISHAEMKTDLLKIEGNLSSLNPATSTIDLPELSQTLQLYTSHQRYPVLALLANQAQTTNAEKILLSKLYTEFALPQEAISILTQVQAAPASMRGDPWLSYGKLLYQTQQNTHALQFLRDPPPLLSLQQDAERRIMIANLLTRLNQVNEAIAVLRGFQSPLYYYQKLARYNLALLLLKKNSASPAFNIERERIATEILEDLLDDKIPPLKPLVSEQPLDVQPLDDRDPEHRTWFSWYGFSKQQAPLPRAVTDSSRLPRQFFKVDSVSAAELDNLNDQIALSLANLRLLHSEPRLARIALRGIRLDSPNSKAALLTSAYIYAQQGDYANSFTFADALAHHNLFDPMVQEAWLVSASALEDANHTDALARYQAAIQMYKSQLALSYQFDRDLEQFDLLKTFTATDPISLDFPVIPKTAYAGLWSQLLQHSDIVSQLQKTRQDQLLKNILTQQGKQLAAVEVSHTQPLDQAKLRSTRILFDQVQDQLNRQQDQKTLVISIRQTLQQQQDELKHYLTEALLGVQRLSAGSL